MIPGFGKQTIIIGSAAHCDIVLAGPGVAPEHATLTHQGGGKLVLVCKGVGQTFSGEQPVAPGQPVPFDLQTPFRLGQVTIPFDAPAIALSLMAPGQHPMQHGRITIGRDPARATIVLQHPSVSNVHCSISPAQRSVTDHSSTSGTYVGGQKITPEQPTPLPQAGAFHLGAVPIAMDLLYRLVQALGAANSGAVPAASGGAPATPGVSPAIHQPAARPQQPQLGTSPKKAGSTPMKKHKTVFGQLNFGGGGAGGGVKTVGRTPNNDIVVTHPQVSSSHAKVEFAAGKLYVTDGGSANGTYVRGHRIAPGQKVEIQSGEKIYVGPMPLQLVAGEGGAVEVVHEAYGDAKWGNRPLYEIEALRLTLVVPDREDKSKDKVLLEDISFKALPGDMIALMGPSGAGKTTLLLALNGYKPPTEGVIRINGEDLYDIYDLLRGSIGYVPQDDLVHPELTVFEAVRYSARFRLPPDYTDQEIDDRVNQTLVDLGLESVGGLEIGSPEKKILSGGQRKRVNIALELVTDPVILYLDEPTSGLAADDAASLIDLLHKLTKATGKTILMTIHQPAKDEYEKFSHTLILGYGGVPIFYGPTAPDSYDFFNRWAKQKGQEKVDNPRDLFAQITDRELDAKRQAPDVPRDVTRKNAAIGWRHEFFHEKNPTYMKMYSGRRAVGEGQHKSGVPDRNTSTRGQFGLLLSRYFRTKRRDISGTGIMLAQAPIIGILLAMVFGGQTEEAPAWCLGALRQLASEFGQAKGSKDIFSTMTTTQDHTAAVFFLVVSAIWFGTSNAAREIVRERAIYLRERMVNLGLFNYVMSKFVLLSVLCLVQCTMLLGIVFFALGFHGGAPAFFQELAALVSTSIAAVALGLLLSTLVTSSEAAMALTPIALIPQVVLGGLMVPATTIPGLAPVMNSVPARWGFEAAVLPERQAIYSDPAWLINLGDPSKSSSQHFITAGEFQCAKAQMASDNLSGAWSFVTYDVPWVPYAVLWGMTFSILILLTLILKRRDPV